MSVLSVAVSRHGSIARNESRRRAESHGSHRAGSFGYRGNRSTPGHLFLLKVSTYINTYVCPHSARLFHHTFSSAPRGLGSSINTLIHYEHVINMINFPVIVAQARIKTWIFVQTMLHGLYLPTVRDGTPQII